MVNEKFYKEEYHKVKSSGMMWEFHPEFSGNWNEDKIGFYNFYKLYREMDFLKQLDADIITAMKNKDSDTLRSLRALKLAISTEKTAKNVGILDDAKILQILQKQIKNREEVSIVYKEQGREDLVEIEMTEANILKKYLPEQLNVEDVEIIVKKVVAEVNATTKKDIGKVMNHSDIIDLGGQIDKKTLVRLIQSHLS